MNITDIPDGLDANTARRSRSMNASQDQELQAVPFNRDVVRQKCRVCDDPIGDKCFCKIHRNEGVPITLCQPRCVIQYIDSSRPPTDSAEAELSAYEKNTHFFIGEDKPWS